MKTIDWNRVERIGYSARQLVLNNPQLGEESVARSMLFLLEVIGTLRSQRDSFLADLKATRGKSHSSSEVSNG